MVAFKYFQIAFFVTFSIQTLLFGDSCFDILKQLGVPYEVVNWKGEESKKLTKRINELARRVLNKEPQAEKELFKVLAGIVFPITLIRTGINSREVDVHRAQDIMQETIKAVFERIRDNKVNEPIFGDSAVKYIHGMARNKWRDSKREKNVDEILIDPQYLADPKKKI